ncbi:FeS cluster assembly protein SufB [compost metagenome]
MPLQAYFRINSENMGQFERTLILADEDSFVHYVEGCTAPIYSTNSLHSAVVEILCMKNARVRYTTIQNWAPNIYNLVTKRAVAEENATMEWVDGNIGSKLTMKYPAVVLKGRGAKGSVLSIAVAGKDQHQDAGAKMIHLAPDTTSTIVSKSISKHGGKVTYRGLASFGRQAEGAKANIKCDTLILDNQSTSDTIPYNEIMNDNVILEHEATVSKVSEEQLFYLMSRGLTEADATQMIIMGFIEPFTKELPMEYAVEMNRLIKFEMEGSIG